MEAAPHWLWYRPSQRPRRRGLTAGFSLIELLIAVAIIMIIMAIAIPNLGKLRKNTNATAAEGNMKTLATVLNAYATEYPNVGYPPSLKALGPPSPGTPDSSSSAGLIDATMAGAGTAAKQGYIYRYAPESGTPCNGFTIAAVPQNGAGSRYFFMTQDGAIHFADNTPATASSPVF
ncbi:MAG: prepilin-type N-terminal cleavage/methylation domain-containing protein [Terriglobales bacterium]